MLQRTFFAMAVVLGLAATANAGSVHLYLLTDPATTAGAGVAAANGMNVTSTRSGAGTWQLYAVDDATGSFGIAQVKATMVGATHISNRMTTTLYDNDDNSGLKAGLSLLRSGNGVPSGTTNPVFASAELAGTQPQFIGGLGQTAGNYPDALTGETLILGTTSGQWGNYSASNGLTQGIVEASGHTRNALLIAEGTHGGNISVDLATSFIAMYNSAALTTSFQSTPANSANPLVATNPFFVIPEPASIALLGLALVGSLGVIRRRS